MRYMCDIASWEFNLFRDICMNRFPDAIRHLAEHSLLYSVDGRNGGYYREAELSDIPVLDVVDACDINFEKISAMAAPALYARLERSSVESLLKAAREYGLFGVQEV